MKNTETPMTAANDTAVYAQRFQVMRWCGSALGESSPPTG
jgi:hypothetical protein